MFEVERRSDGERLAAKIINDVDHLTKREVKLMKELRSPYLMSANHVFYNKDEVNRKQIVIVTDIAICDL